MDVMRLSYEACASGGYQEPWGREYPRQGGLPLAYGIDQGLSQDRTTHNGWVGVIADCLHVSFADLCWHTGEAQWQHRRTYCSQMQPGRRHGVLGPGWILADMPFMVAKQREEGGLSLGVVGGVASVAGFDADGVGRWLAQIEEAGRLNHDTVDRSFRFTVHDGMTWVFHNFENGLPRQMRGRLKGVEFSTGGHARIEYGENDEISRVAWLNTQGGITEFRYEYEDGSAESPRLQSVTLFDDDKPLSRIRYSYHAVDGRLRQSAKELWSKGSWQLNAEVVYRYLGSTWLREIDLFDQASGHSELPSIRYQIQYEGAGKVRWVRHEGLGAPPVFMA